MGTRFFSIIVILVLLPSVLWSGPLSIKGKRFIGFPENSFAFGVFMGEPSGIRLYYFSSWKKSWAFTTGYSFNKVGVLNVDRIFYGYSAKDKVIDANFWNNLVFYAGPGVLVGYGLDGSDRLDAFQSGIRVVGGSEYIFSETALSMRLEVAPQVYLKASQGFGVSVGIGFTYYFGAPTRTAGNRFSKTPENSSEELDEFK